MSDNRQRHTTNATVSHKLRIWQQNLNKSPDAQAELINNIEHYDIVIIQEPCLDHLNRTRTTSRWRVIYPSTHFRDGSLRTRSVILVNTSLSTGSWTQIELQSADVTALQIITEIGTVRLFNIYNPGDGNDESLTLVKEYVDLHPIASAHDIWAGDFNRHHPMWELPSNPHLMSTAYIEAAMPLINIIADYDLEMVLPAGIPTLEALRTRNHTRPDNIFCSTNLALNLIYCKTMPEQRPVLTDHYPIATEFDISVPRAQTVERRNIRAIVWEDFREDLKAGLDMLATTEEIRDTDEVERRLKNLNEVVMGTIEKHAPIIQPCPYRKRWWSDELTQQRANKQRLAHDSYKQHDDPMHPIHEIYRQARNEYTQAIRRAKTEHWIEWLEGAVSEGEDLWKAAKMMNSEAHDGGRDRVPDLLDGQVYVSDNTEKSKVFYKAFFPPPPAKTYAPPDATYPPRYNSTTISNERIQRVFRKMKLHKATYPGTPPNNVLHHCADLLAPHIGPIYRATFTLEYYPGEWPMTMTIIARKPGKSDYRKADAHRPLSISGGWPRGLNACVTEEIQYLTEKHHLLPDHQFGGRPGRSTIDLLLSLTNEIKAAWRRGEVASILSMDVKAAFPSVDVEMLFHEMRSLGLPETYVTWMHRRLIDRQTVLAFDDYVSDPFPVESGLDQGDPFSLLCYIIYNGGLLRLLKTKEGERGGLFVDDNNVLVTGKTFAETHEKILDVMWRDHGVLDWAVSHNCVFGFPKFQLTDFSPKTEEYSVALASGGTETRRRPLLGEAIEIEEDIFIKPSASLKLVGVILDAGLRWKEQATASIARGQSWLNKFRRLSKISRGAASPAIRRLYEAIAVPQILYGAELYLTPQRKSTWMENGQRKTGRRESQWIVAQLRSLQRQAAILITGGMRSTAADTLDHHANLMPMEARIKLVRHRAASRLGSLPPTHPLHKVTKQLARIHGKRHRGPMHELVQEFSIDPLRTETILPARQHPEWSFRGDIDVSMGEKKAIELEQGDRNEYKIFTDGSGFNDQVGASAVCYRLGAEIRQLRYRLGSLKYHEVADGECVGLILALHILLSLTDVKDVTIYLDNQAVAQATGNRRSQASHYLYDALLLLVSAAYRKHPDLQLHLRWIPGHKGVQGNERADALAKDAAMGQVNETLRLPEVLRRSLPRNLVSIRKTYKASITNQVRHKWSTSKRYLRLRNIDSDSLRPVTYQKLISPLSRAHSSLLMQLRTQHISLNMHLYRIQRSLSPSCPNCGHAAETVCHYLTQCVAYRNARQRMLQKIGRAAYSVSSLLTCSKHLPALMAYIQETGRFHSVFGNIPKVQLPALKDKGT